MSFQKGAKKRIGQVFGGEVNYKELQKNDIVWINMNGQDIQMKISLMNFPKFSGKQVKVSGNEVREIDNKQIQIEEYQINSLV